MRLDRDLWDVDLYQVLGVPPTAPHHEIRRAYRRLVSISHPDLVRDDLRRAEQRMAQINVAAGVLLDATRRANYDRFRGTRRRPRRSASPSRSRPPPPPVDVSKVRLTAHDLALVEQFRSRPARAFTALEEWLGGWTPEFRVAFLFASMAVAVGLIRLAKPTSLPSPFEDEQPRIAANVSSTRT